MLWPDPLRHDSGVRQAGTVPSTSGAFITIDILSRSLLQDSADEITSTLSLDGHLKTMQTTSHRPSASMVTSRQCRQHDINVVSRSSPQDNADNINVVSRYGHLKTMQTTSHQRCLTMVTSRQCRQHHIVSRSSPQDNADKITSTLSYDRHLKTMQTTSHRPSLSIVNSRQYSQHRIDVVSRSSPQLTAGNKHIDLLSLDRHLKTMQSTSHQRSLSIVTSRQCSQHHINVLSRSSPQDNAVNITSTLSLDRHLKTTQSASHRPFLSIVTSRQRSRQRDFVH